MVRILKTLRVVLLLLLASATCLAESPSRYTLNIGADLSFVDASGYSSWTQGSVGKLRYDSDTDGFALAQAFLDYKLRVADTVNVKLLSDIQQDFGSTVDLAELFAEWRPLTVTPNRYRFKVGAFYPRISLENTEAGWRSPYSTSPSAINTWIGEEIRVLGTEATVSRRPMALGGAHTFSLSGAVFYGNDPAGTLLAWRGWSAHDRQARFRDKLPLPPVPQLQPGMFFQNQDPYTQPFLEIDGAAGYYVSGEWAASKRILLRAMHYDNRADPVAADGGQFGWRTNFDHVGFQATLPGDVGLISQWIKGATVWGRETNGVHAVDADFKSHFFLLTKSFLNQRLSLRFERFEVTENDQVPFDNNSENGHVWMVAYQVGISRYASVAAEWLEIETYREAWEYFGLEKFNTETQLQLTVRLRFGNHP